MFSPENPYTAYCFSCWWSDNWDAKTYAREYDFSKPFFKQFKELLFTVPRPGKIQQGNIVNSPYSNRVSDMKNCYLCFGSFDDEDCSYDCWVNYSRECLDCYGVNKGERCYECVDCSGSYNLFFSQESQSCSDSYFLFNCRNCTECFGCVNLRNKSNCIFNVQYSKEEYKEKLSELLENKNRENVIQKFNALRNESAHPHMIYRQVKDVTGNWIEESTSMAECFSCFSVEHGRYLFNVMEAKDSMDHCFWGKATELIYEAVNVGRQCSNVKFANECWNQLRDSEYVMNCHNSHDLFGCIGLRNAEYCIFNKQYTKEEYATLVPKIKKHMDEMPYRDARGIAYSYGSFFPSELSPFAYNESIAQEYFPKTKAAALSFGSQWKTSQERSYGITFQPEDIPQKIELISDTITNEIIGCLNKGKEETLCTTAFRITPEELSFYRKLKLSIPHFCPNCRHFARLSKRTQMRLYTRQCSCTQTNHIHKSVCLNTFETSYPPENPAKVYCEKCYQAEVT